MTFSLVGRPGKKLYKKYQENSQEFFSTLNWNDQELTKISEFFKNHIEQYAAHIDKYDQDYKNIENLLRFMGIFTEHSLECTLNNFKCTLSWKHATTGWKFQITLIDKDGEEQHGSLLSADSSIKIAIKPYVVQLVKQIQNKFNALLDGMHNIQG